VNVVLVTGAASGLGWSLTQHYLARGDTVVMADMNEALLDERRAQLASASVITVAGDLTGEQCQQRVEAVLQENGGRLDILVNNAGITHRSLVAKTDPAVLEKVMRVDWLAPVQLTCRLLPLLARSHGTIINIGSMAGWMPVLGRAAYCAAKGALAQFFEVLRCEVEQQGIHVLNVYPSFLDTPIEQNALGADGKPARHARSTAGAMRSADWMANEIVIACAQRRPWLFPDRLSWFGSCLWRLWPSLYLRLMRKRFASELLQ
jgi:NAD(P)-dependent dehydrogenase (short-subunit alcohol dehydrogenase family)